MKPIRNSHSAFFHNQLQFRLSGTKDLEAYFIDQPSARPSSSPDRATFSSLNPRLWHLSSSDGQIGPYISSFVQARLDRGFDPSDGGAQVRLDEYAVRVSPWEDGRATIQAGKFATVVGNWVPRHYFPWITHLTTARRCLTRT